MPGLPCTHPLYTTVMLVCVCVCVCCWQSNSNQSIVCMAVNIVPTYVLC